MSDESTPPRKAVPPPPGLKPSRTERRITELESRVEALEGTIAGLAEIIAAAAQAKRTTTPRADGKPPISLGKVVGEVVKAGIREAQKQQGQSPTATP